VPDTLSSIREEVLGWLRGDFAAESDQPLLNAALNDAVEDIWSSMMAVQLARFFGLDSPVTFSLPSGAERVQLVSIADPATPVTVGQVAGGALAARTYRVAYSYVTESGSETLVAPTTSFAVSLNNVAQVTAPAQVAQAIGWNCYVSVTNDAALMGLQNQQPLPFGVPFTEVLAGWQDYPGAQQQPGPVSAASQATPAGAPPPSANTTADNIAWITQMEIRSGDTVLRSWNQHDLNSDVMRRLGRTVASASEYQSYAWDLLNGNRLEIRPAAGLALTPRYFYIARPRRLRYGQAAVPYTHISGVHEFLVNRAVARMKLSVDEYEAASAWSGMAEAVRQQIIRSLRTEDWNKNTRITPHLF